MPFADLLLVYSLDLLPVIFIMVASSCEVSNPVLYDTQ